MSRQAKDLERLAKLARLVSDRDLAELAAVAAARQGAEARRSGLIAGLAEARAGVVAGVGDGAEGGPRTPEPAGAGALDGFAALDRHTVAVMRGLARTEEEIARLTDVWLARRQVAARSFGRVLALAELARGTAAGARRT